MAQPQPIPSLAVAAYLGATPSETGPCSVCGRRGIDVVQIYELTTCGNARCQLAALQSQSVPAGEGGVEQAAARKEDT